MSAQEQTAGQPAAATTETQEASLLDLITEGPEPAKRDAAKDTLSTIVKMLGVQGRDKTVTRMLNKLIAAVDAKMSTQLAAIMHAPEFLKLGEAGAGCIISSKTPRPAKP